LQSGDVLSPVSIIVKTYFEDMILACPRADYGLSDSNRGTLANVSFRNSTLQGDYKEEIQVGEAETAKVEKLGMLYSGEIIPSLRSLLHRSYLVNVRQMASNNFNTYGRTGVAIPFTRFPLPRLAASPYIDQTTSVDPTSVSGGVGPAVAWNMNATTPIAYIGAAFVGFRGSLVWRVLDLSGGAKSSTQFLASETALTAPLRLEYDGTSTSAGLARFMLRNISSGLGGLTSVREEISGNISVVSPQYDNFRMRSCNFTSLYGGPPYGGGTAFRYYYNKALTWIGYYDAPASVDQRGTTDTAFSVSAGTDFNFLHFVNVPDIYILPLTKE
jgi:hypothetical protein